MPTILPPGGLLLVHAHPDDESIETGATMARYAAEGVHVTLVTCTLGELGEVIPAALAYLADGIGDRLGEYRRGELAAACAALGVSDHRFLGGAGRWRDSGMAGLESNNAPDCFWQADVAEAAADLAEVIREVRPRVLVTYDKNGFYGHPDHIQAHRVSRRAVTVAADPAAPLAGEPWRVAKFYATAMPRSVAAAAGGPYWVPDEQVTTEIDGCGYLAAKTAALRSHATQITVDGEFFALADGAPQRIGAREFYTLAAGPAPRIRTAGPEHDLFAGLVWLPGRIPCSAWTAGRLPAGRSARPRPTCCCSCLVPWRA